MLMEEAKRIDEEETVRPIKQAAASLNDFYLWRRPDQRNRTLQFIKVLGRGGFGIASLFNYQDHDNPADNNHVVVKLGLKSALAIHMPETNWGPEDIEKRASFRREVQFMNLFARHKHMVQAMILGNGLDPTTGIPGYWELPHAYVSTMEYCVRGELKSLIDRRDVVLHKHNTTDPKNPGIIPNNVIWLIADCLFKACVAMEYPVPAAVLQPQFEEEFPHRRKIVHHDIDWWNIFVNDIDPPGGGLHPDVPKFQLGDYGLMIDYDKGDPWAPSGGKDNLRAPETYGRYRKAQRFPIDARANIFQMGVVCSFPLFPYRSSISLLMHKNIRPFGI